MDRASWRGILEVEADYIALRDETGEATPIQDLFVGVEQIVTPEIREEPVGPGLPPMQTLVYEDPTDDQVPGLASLLEYLEQDRAPKHYHISTQRHNAWFPEGPMISQRRVNTRMVNIQRPHLSEHIVYLTRKGPPGPVRKGRVFLIPDVVVHTHTKTHMKSVKRPLIIDTESPMFYTKTRSSRSVVSTTRKTQALPHTDVWVTKGRTGPQGPRGARGASGTPVEPLIITGRSTHLSRLMERVERLTHTRKNGASGHQNRCSQPRIGARR